MINNDKNILSMYKNDKAKFKENFLKFISDGKVCIEEFKNKETRKKQIPNLLTSSRLFAPFLIIPAALSQNLLLTFIITSAFLLTDALDGKYARKYNAYSEFGRELDPITDKIFATSLLLPLIAFNPIISINLVLEGIIATINTHSRLNDNKPKTVIIGKIKTFFLSLTMLLSYININEKIDEEVITTFIGATTILQIGSAIKYHNEYKKEEIKKELTKEEQIKELNKLKEELISKETPILENAKVLEYINKQK